MPEGPELHLASRFVNRVARDHMFSGNVEKSAVSTKNPDVDWNVKSYAISAQSRGKEVKLTLTEVPEHDAKPKNKKQDSRQTMDILFRFGMSGKFTFTKRNERPKHAHLNFFTSSGDMVLSFVDYRRFGRWEVNGDWSKERGPCVLQEYGEFRKHVLENIGSPVFEKPVCEVLLNQKYFNGIGNYLRAEILYRAKIPPFVSARSVLEKLVIEGDQKEVKIKSEKADFLQLCNILPTEVINLGGTGYNPDTGTGDLSDFTKWLRCYYCDSMKNMVDHNGRTIWFFGEAGPLRPNETKSRCKKRYSKTAQKPSRGKNSLEAGESPRKKQGHANTAQTSKPAKVSTRTPKKEAFALENSRVTRSRLNKAKQESASPYFSERHERKSTLKTPKLPISSKQRKTKRPKVKAILAQGLVQPDTPKPRSGGRKSSRLRSASVKE